MPPNEVYRTDDVLEENPSSFEEMLIKEEILKGLKDGGFLTPSPIQSAAIPVAMLATDLIAQAKSGTGKTCVFVSSILTSLDCTSFQTQALVLAPTREIAVQVRDVFRTIGKYLPNLECHAFIGGIQMKSDIQLLKLGCQVAVGTPGRVLELIDKAHMKTMFLQTVVLDEADQLFGPSFEDTIIQILNLVPQQKQLMAFTATLLDDIEEKISSHMLEPQLLCIDQLKPSLKGVKQFFKKIDLPEETESTSEQSIATQNHKLLKVKVDTLIRILTTTSFNQAVVFSNNKRRAHDIAETLTKNGWPTKHIHGSQSQSQRLMVFEKLRNFKIRILVSSDVTARGIDIERLTLVINLDIPHDAETYMHRVGRTGRFGTKGVAITFVTPDEATKFDEMVKKLQAAIEPLPPQISQEMLNLWLKEGEKETLDDLEKHRERAMQREATTLREPILGQFKSSNKRKRRGKQKTKKEKKKLIEPRFCTGETVMASYQDSAWEEAVVLELTNNNHTAKLNWKRGKTSSRPVYNVVKYEKPNKIEVGCTYLGCYDGEFYVCRVESIDHDEVEIIWREWDESCDFPEDAILDVHDLLAFNEHKDLHPYWNKSENGEQTSPENLLKVEAPKNILPTVKAPKNILPKSRSNNISSSTEHVTTQVPDRKPPSRNTSASTEHTMAQVQDRTPLPRASASIERATTLRYNTMANASPQVLPTALNRNSIHSPMTQSMKDEYVFYDPSYPSSPNMGGVARSVAPSVATNIPEDQNLEIPPPQIRSLSNASEPDDYQFFKVQSELSPHPVTVHPRSTAPSVATDFVEDKSMVPSVTQSMREEYVFHEPKPAPPEYERSIAPSVATILQEDQNLSGYTFDKPYYSSVPVPQRVSPAMQQRMQPQHPQQRMQPRHPQQRMRHQSSQQRMHPQPPQMVQPQRMQRQQLRQPYVHNQFPTSHQQPHVAAPQYQHPQKFNQSGPFRFPRVMHTPGVFYPVAHSLPSPPTSSHPQAVAEACRNAALFCSSLIQR